MEVVGTTVDDARIADVEALATPFDNDAPAMVDCTELPEAAIDEDPDDAAAVAALPDGCTVTVTTTVVWTVTTCTPEGVALEVATETGALVDDAELGDVLGAADTGEASLTPVATRRWRVNPEIDAVAEGDKVGATASSTFSTMVQSSPSPSSVDAGLATAVAAVARAEDEEAVGTEVAWATLVLISIVHSGSFSGSLVGSTEAVLVGADVESGMVVEGEASVAVGATTVLFPKRLAATPACVILSMASSWVSQAIAVPSLFTSGRTTHVVPPAHC